MSNGTPGNDEAVPRAASNGHDELLSREAILGQAEAGELHEDIPVPEWGGKVRVKALSGIERDRYERSILEEKKSGRFKTRLEGARAKLVVAAAIDAKGERLFSQADVEALGRKSAAALNRVWEAAARLAGMKEEDLDELVGDLDDDLSEATTSAGR